MRFVDVEAMVIAFLRDRIDAAISTTVPSPRPEPMVRLWRNGGPAVNRVLERAQITVETWSADSVTASELATACRTALLSDYTAMPLVRGVTEITGPYSTTDPDTETPRYRFTVELTVRATR